VRDNAAVALSFLDVLKFQLKELRGKVEAMSGCDARDEEVAPGTPGEDAVSDSGGGDGGDGGVHSDGSDGTSAGASRSKSSQEGDSSSGSLREQRDVSRRLVHAKELAQECQAAANLGEEIRKKEAAAKIDNRRKRMEAKAKATANASVQRAEATVASAQNACSFFVTVIREKGFRLYRCNYLRFT
jgi:hypothetical protein